MWVLGPPLLTCLYTLPSLTSFRRFFFHILLICHHCLLRTPLCPKVRCNSLDTVSGSPDQALTSATLQSTPLPEIPPPVMVLFSGGVDSVLVAALAHRSLPPGCPIDLCNVCFDSGRSPDRLSARAALKELSGWAPERAWRLIEVDATLEDTDKNK